MRVIFKGAYSKIDISVSLYLLDFRTHQRQEIKFCLVKEKFIR